jgi:hypothetical protein
MTWQRFEIEARLEDGMSEGRVDGSALQLVTVCLCDEGAGEVSDFQRRAGAQAAGGQLPAPRQGARFGVLPAGAGRTTDGAGNEPCEPFCNPPVAARRVLSPFAGLRRVGPARCTPEIRRLRGRGAAVRKVCCRRVRRRDAGVSVNCHSCRSSCRRIGR